MDDTNIALTSFHPLLSWRSIVAGLLVSLFAFAALLCLGIAVGGVSLQDGATLQNSGTMGGLWIVLSVLISLFLAGYFTARTSNFASSSIGMGQGVVLAALFTGFVLWQAIGVAGWLTRSAGSLVGGAAQMSAPVAGQAASALSPAISDAIEDNLAGVQLNGDPKTIVTGVASRLIRGDTEAAKAYLARNSNLTVPEVNAKIDEVNQRMQQAGNDARIAAAKAMQVSGWTLFGFLMVSLIGSVLGGLLGARSNRQVPVQRRETQGLRRPQPVFT